jgi:hypothetical protein
MEEEELEKYQQEVVKLYFAGYSVEQALEVVKNERKLGSTDIRNS